MTTHRWIRYLLFSVAGLGLGGLLVWLVLNTKELCGIAHSTLERTPSLTAEFGHPVDIRCRWWDLAVSESGIAYVGLDVEGPRGKGTIDLTLIKKHSTWEIKEIRVIPTTPVSWSDRKFLLAVGHWGIGLFFLFLTILLGRRFAAQRGFSLWKWTLGALLFNVLLLPYIAWISGVGEKRYRIQALSLFACFLLWIAIGMYFESVGLI